MTCPRWHRPVSSVCAPNGSAQPHAAQCTLQHSFLSVSLFHSTWSILTTGSSSLSSLCPSVSPGIQHPVHLTSLPLPKLAKRMNEFIQQKYLVLFLLERMSGEFSPTKCNLKVTNFEGRGISTDTIIDHSFN